MITNPLRCVSSSRARVSQYAFDSMVRLDLSISLGRWILETEPTIFVWLDT